MAMEIMSKYIATYTNLTRGINGKINIIAHNEAEAEDIALNIIEKRIGISIRVNFNLSYEGMLLD